MQEKLEKTYFSIFQDPKYPTGSAYPIIRGIMFYNITNIRLRLRLGMTGVTTMNPLATLGPVARAAAMVTAVARHKAGNMAKFHKTLPIISFL